MDWATIASVATAIGVAIGVWQIREASNLAQAQFEDSLDQQYRDLAHGIPVDALIGKAVKHHQAYETRELIYNYLDLCNEQIFLRKKKRVRRDTWHDWCSGIKANLNKQAFQAVWIEVKQEAPGTFSFLEQLETLNFKTDPCAWD